LNAQLTNATTNNEEMNDETTTAIEMSVGIDLTTDEMTDGMTDVTTDETTDAEMTATEDGTKMTADEVNNESAITTKNTAIDGRNRERRTNQAKDVNNKSQK
jgi:hypothetical protein